MQLISVKILIDFWEKLTPITKKLCLFTVFNIILVNLIVLIVIFPPHRYDTVLVSPHRYETVKLPPHRYKTALFHTFNFLRIHQKVDSWKPMEEAFNYLQSKQQKPLYYEIFFNKKTKFQYPVTSLLIFSILKTIIPLNTSWSGILGVISWIFVIIMIVFVIEIFNLSLKGDSGDFPDCSSKSELIIRAVLIVTLVLTFYPVVKAYTLGQIQVWINSLFTILFWCWMKEKKEVAGIIAGIICLLKPQYTIILLWSILRKQWVFVSTFITTILIGLLTSILVFGFINNINYLRVLSYIAKHGESFYPNQSVNGLLNRLLFNGNNLEWIEHSFPPFHPWVYFGTLSSSLVLISIALLRPKKQYERGNIIDFSIISITCTMASPVAWEHHYGILLPIYAFVFPYLLKQESCGKALVLLCTSYFLSSNYFPATNKLAYTPFNFVQSYLFFAGLMLLGYLYFSRDGEVIRKMNTVTDNHP
jgi:hypothetical protein